MDVNSAIIIMVMVMARFKLESLPVMWGIKGELEFWKIFHLHLKTKPPRAVNMVRREDKARQTRVKCSGMKVIIISNLR